MTQAQLIKELKRLIDLHGAVKVSFWLNYKDTRAVKKWVKDKKIPPVRVDSVKALLEETNIGVGK